MLVTIGLLVVAQNDLIPDIPDGITDLVIIDCFQSAGGSGDNVSGDCDLQWSLNCCQSSKSVEPIDGSNCNRLTHSDNRSKSVGVTSHTASHGMLRSIRSSSGLAVIYGGQTPANDSSSDVRRILCRSYFCWFLNKFSNFYSNCLKVFWKFQIKIDFV